MSSIKKKFILIACNMILTLLLCEISSAENENIISNNEERGCYTYHYKDRSLIDDVYNFYIYKIDELTCVWSSHERDIIFEGKNSSTVINNIPKDDVKIYIKDGLYDIDAALYIGRNSTIDLGRRAILKVPSGYRGAVFVFSDGVRNSIIAGGQVIEERPVKRKWLGLYFESRNRGIYANSVRDIWIRDAGVAIKLSTVSKKGWINGNEFNSIKIWRPNIFILFEENLKSIGGRINRNLFYNMIGQAGKNTIYGAKNISGNGNLFFDVKFWDLSHASISSSISKKSDSTIIIGGIMTNKNFMDKGSKTQIIDQFIDTYFENINVNRINILNSLNIGNNSELMTEDNLKKHGIESNGIINSETAIMNSIIIKNKKPDQFGWHIFENDGKLLLKDMRTDATYEFQLLEIDR